MKTTRYTSIHQPALTVDEMEQYGVDPDESATVTRRLPGTHSDPPTFMLTEEQRMQLPDPFQNDHIQGRNNYLHSVECMTLFVLNEEETEE